MAGLTEARGPNVQDDFWSWRKLMYQFLDCLNPDQIEAIAAQAFMEMLEAGYANVAEFHYLHHDLNGSRYSKLSELSERMISAAEKVGIGLTLLPVFYQFGGCDKRDLQGGQLRFKNDLDQYLALLEEVQTAIERSSSDFNFGIAPHSLRACAKYDLKTLANTAKDAPFHLHLAEQVGEVKEVLQHFGARPVEWLLSNFDVDKNWCLIHCTQMTEEETANLAKTGSVAGLCPITESSLGDGIFSAVEFLDHNGTLGIGTDSNIEISLFQEIKTLEYSQRLRDKSRVVLASENKSNGRFLFDRILCGGTQASQRTAGQISEGYLADFIGISSNNSILAGRSGDVAIDTLVFGGNGKSCISDVWSAGRHVVKDGFHHMRNVVEYEYIEAMNEVGGAL